MPREFTTLDQENMTELLDTVETAVRGAFRVCDVELTDCIFLFHRDGENIRFITTTEAHDTKRVLKKAYLDLKSGRLELR